jgi:Tfp pilus assembly protein PilO
VKAYRRQRQQYLFGVLLGIFGIINLLFFFILYQPARSEYYGLQSSIEQFRADIRSRGMRIQTLERLNSQLATLEQDRARLFTMHFIPRQAGWSEILPKLEHMVLEAGVDNTHKDYSIDSTPQYGLYSVKIRIPAEGPYPSVVNFIKDLEKSETFFIINSIDLHGSAQALPGSKLQLALNVETFFYQ